MRGFFREVGVLIVRCLAWMVVVAYRIYHLYRPTWKLWSVECFPTNPMDTPIGFSLPVVVWLQKVQKTPGNRLLLTTNINSRFPTASGNMF